MAALTVLQGPDKGRVFEAAPEAMLIGRASDNAALTDNTVSRRHAEIRSENGHWIIEDLHSSNGTYLNGKRIERPARLKHGDTIQIGGTVLAWQGDDDVTSLRGRAAVTDLVDLDAGKARLDTSVVSSIPSSDDSMILASPAAADAVRAWHVMAQLSEAIGAVSSPEHLLERVMDILFEQVPAARGFILMKSDETGEFVPTVVRYRGPAHAPDKITTSRTIIDLVVTRKEGVLCTNAMTDSRFSERRRSGSIQALGLRSVICVPIMARDVILGVLHIDTAMSAHTYSEEQLRLVTAIGRMIGLAVEDARLVSERIRTARLAATGEAVASLSHAIKNILQGLRSGADVVEMGLARQQLAVIDQGWQICQRNLEKIYTLTLNMLAYAKERQPRLEMTDLNRVAQEVVELLRRRADDKGVLIRTDFDDPFPPIPIDADGIQQVVLNLVTNAIDAAPKTTGVVQVRTRFEAAESEAVLIIGDNGPGIAEEQIPHIFTPFHSTKGQGGTGLGLAVARKIVEEHHGRIDIRSDSGHGTLVTVTLSARQSVDLDSSATQAPRRQI